jgi:hypothetical protein
MFQQLFNWRTTLAFVAILIVSGTIFYSQYLARKIAKEERQKVEQWAEAGKFLINSTPDGNSNLAIMIITENKSIPIIETDEKDSITNHINIDSASIARDPGYLASKLKEFRSYNRPFDWISPADSAQRNRYY